MSNQRSVPNLTLNDSARSFADICIIRNGVRHAHRRLDIFLLDGSPRYLIASPHQLLHFYVVTVHHFCDSHGP